MEDEALHHWGTQIDNMIGAIRQIRPAKICAMSSVNLGVEAFLGRNPGDVARCVKLGMKRRS